MKGKREAQMIGEIGAVGNSKNYDRQKHGNRRGDHDHEIPGILFAICVHYARASDPSLETNSRRLISNIPMPIQTAMLKSATYLTRRGSWNLSVTETALDGREISIAPSLSGCIERFCPSAAAIQ